MMSHVKVHSSTTYHILLVDFGELPTKLIKTNAHFVLEYPLVYNSIMDKFQSLSQNVVLGNLKSFFQLDHQAYIGLYVTEPPHSTTLRNYPV